MLHLIEENDKVTSKIWTFSIKSKKKMFGNFFKPLQRKKTTFSCVFFMKSKNNCYKFTVPECDNSEAKIRQMMTSGVKTSNILGRRNSPTVISKCKSSSSFIWPSFKTRRADGVEVMTGPSPTSGCFWCFLLFLQIFLSKKKDVSNFWSH